MTKALNLYGDRLIKTTTRHGADISSQRMDDLDVETLMHALREKERRGIAIDLGGGIGIQGLRLATLGFATVLIDWIPIEMTVIGVAGADRLFPISYLRKDARDLTAGDLADEVVLCYSQRFIHYLRFSEGVSLLRLIRSKMRVGAKLFLSASGLASELGNGYRGRDQELTERFSRLAPEVADTHGIHEAVCLYNPEDLVKLCAMASFKPDRVFSSPFGNVKGIFSAAE